MEPPDGVVGEPDGKVCKLNKAIYWLKQASRQWNRKLGGSLMSLKLKLDPCIHFDTSGDKKLLHISVYIDDLLIFSNNSKLKSKMKSQLEKLFAMKDLGVARNGVGLCITRNREKGEILQSDFYTF